MGITFVAKPRQSESFGSEKSAGARLRTAVPETAPAQALLLFICGVAVYLPFLTQRLANPDTLLNGLYEKRSGAWEVSLGRFGLVLYDALRGGVVMPTLSTLLAVALAAVAGIAVARYFGLRGMPALLGGGFVLLCPWLADLLTYYYCSSPYMLAFALAVAAALLLRRKTLLCFAAAGLALVASLSIYQAYLFVTAALCLLAAVLALLREEKPIGKVLAGLGVQAAVCAAAAGLWAVLAAVLQWAWGIDSTTARFSGTGGAWAGLLTRVKETYYYFFHYFFTDQLLYNSFMARRWWNLALVVLAVLALLAVVVQRGLWRHPARLICALTLLAALPLAVMGVVAVSAQYSLTEATGILAVPAVPLCYVFALALWGEVRFPKRPPLRCALPVCAAVLLGVMLCWTASFENFMQYQQQRYLTVGNLVTQRLTQEYGPLQGRRMMLLGTLNGESRFPCQKNDAKRIAQWTVAPYGMVWDSLQGQMTCWQALCRDYLGVAYETCDAADYAAFSESGLYDDMPLFPQEGSIMEWNDILVVKLGAQA